MKQILTFLMILLILLVTSSCNVANERSQLPEFNEARIVLNDYTWTVKVDSYEIIDSMFLINTDTGKSILVHTSNCTLVK